MDDVISHAIDLIDQILISCSNPKESPLVNTRNDLHRLLEVDPSRNDWTRLFCRQLKRLMTNDTLIKNDQFWIDIHNDIFCILNQSNNEHNTGANWRSFVERMEFEAKLEQRQIKFEQKYGGWKGLNDLLLKHQIFLSQYFSKCVSFHSKVQVRDLVENLDDFLRNIYGWTQTGLSSENRQYLEEKFKCIEIPLVHHTISLEGLRPTFFEYHNSQSTLNDTPGTFLPSTNQLPYVGFTGVVAVDHLLYFEKWFIIVGEPGSAKTSLLRWLVFIYQKRVDNCIRELNNRRNPGMICRIPILIRLIEFASWLDERPGQTLIDYIGEHTWFSKRYCSDNTENVLKELVCHGYTLILFDGLDEICDAERRGKIVDLLRNFIDEYAQSSEFISAYDDEDIKIKTPYDWAPYIFRMKGPSVSVGNQIIITSRIVGYQMHPLHNHSMMLCSISLMKNEEAKIFARKLVLNIENVLKSLQGELVQILKKTFHISSTDRYKTIESIFENYPKSLSFNPSFIFSICISIFRSPKGFSHKSRIEVYKNTVQSTFISWKNQQTNLSEKLLFNFFIELAVYLHFNSSSGLIDTFDMENLCCSVLKQYYYQSNDRRELRRVAKGLIPSLDSNTGIFAEQSLQVFGFLHRTFQDYFVAQSLVRESSVEDMVERILSNALDPRFREPLLFALGWISWKWSSDDYQQFCRLLVSSRKDFAIPIGSLLFFDAVNDLQTLPSNSIVFIALNSLFEHSSNFIPLHYFIPNLSKLSKEISIEWMKLHLKDEKSVEKFCQCLLQTISESNSSYQRDPVNLLTVPSFIYQQLYLLYDGNSAIPFLIDQTMRKLVSWNKFAIHELNGSIFSEDISISDIHPLILSVIIALCGGIDLECVKDIHKIVFSPKKMHRQSSILSPILDYLTNKNEISSIKLHKLIKHYESLLENVSLTNVSIDTIDTFTALICLQGVDQARVYQKYDEYQAFPIAIQRLKQIGFYLNKIFEILFPSDEKMRKSYIKSEIEIILNEFFSQANQTNEECLVFSLSCAAAWTKLNIDCSSDWFNFDIFHSKNIDRYLECQSEFKHSIINRKIEQMIENRHPLQIFQHQPFFLLTILPQSLQPLYYHLFIAPNNNSLGLPMIVLLSHCLVFLDRVNPWNVNFYLSVLLLLPLLNEYNLESYALILFQQGNMIKLRCRNEDRDEFFKAMKDQIFIDQSKNWEELINIERQRIIDIKDQIQSSERDLRYFAASVCVARLYQQQYGSSTNSTNDPIYLPKTESEEMYFAIMNIFDPILRIVALSMVLNVQYISIFNEEQRDQLNLEIINQLELILPNKSLLISTLLFVRCYTICQTFPVFFQHMIEIIGDKLNETLSRKQTEEQKAVFIALQDLNHPDLFSHLSKFVQQTDNLSDLLLFNSSIFYQYFLHKTLWNSSNPTLLSSMYLTELAFDAQILSSDHQINRLSPKEELDQLWKEFSPTFEKMLTLKIATWITNYPQISNRKDFQLITREVCNCFRVEQKALMIIEKWLEYRMDKDLKILAYYATLILAREGFIIPNMIEIINEIFIFDTKFYFKHLIEMIFRKPSVNPTFIRQILINLHGNRRYFLQISITEIDCQEILQLILTLEFERIDRNIFQINQKITHSYLSMIHSCSNNLESFLKQYISESIKEEYTVVIIRWTIQMSIYPYYLTKFSNEFYQWIFQFLHYERYPRYQKAILNALYSMFNSTQLRRENIFLHNDVFSHMEKIFYSWKTYSEDILAACLLTTGSYILKLKTCSQNPNISDEMRTILLTLYKTSSTELISIRAGFCLIFIDYSNIRFKTILTWFENQESLTVKQRYLIYLQISLYKTLDFIFTLDIEFIKNFIDIFIIDLYYYLYNKENLDYFDDPQPNYIQLALEFCKTNMNIFRQALSNSSFDENDFRKELFLYFYQTNDRNDQKIIIQFSAALYMITDELIQMCPSRLLKAYDGCDEWSKLEIYIFFRILFEFRAPRNPSSTEHSKIMSYRTMFSTPSRHLIRSALIEISSTRVKVHIERKLPTSRTHFDRSKSIEVRTSRTKLSCRKDILECPD